MKHYTLILVLLLCSSIPSLAQIKKQYKDDKAKKTTVVVKEDSANDIEILNEHFNIDDFRVDEQIMITTDGQIIRSSDTTTPTPPPPNMDNAVASTSNIPILEEQPKKVEKAETNQAKKKVYKKKASKAQLKKRKKLKKRKRRLYKKNRKKKRKRMKRKRRKKCYRF